MASDVFQNSSSNHRLRPRVILISALVLIQFSVRDAASAATALSCEQNFIASETLQGYYNRNIVLISEGPKYSDFVPGLVTSEQSAQTQSGIDVPNSRYPMRVRDEVRNAAASDSFADLPAPARQMAALLTLLAPRSIPNRETLQRLRSECARWGIEADRPLPLNQRSLSSNELLPFRLGPDQVRAAAARTLVSALVEAHTAHVISHLSQLLAPTRTNELDRRDPNQPNHWFRLVSRFSLSDELARMGNLKSKWSGVRNEDQLNDLLRHITGGFGARRPEIALVRYRSERRIDETTGRRFMAPKPHAFDSTYAVILGLRLWGPDHPAQFHTLQFDGNENSILTRWVSADWSFLSSLSDIVLLQRPSEALLEPRDDSSL